MRGPHHLTSWATALDALALLSATGYHLDGILPTWLRAMLDSGLALRHVMDAVDAAVSRIGMLGTAEQYGRVVTEQCRETWRRLVRDGVIKGKGDNGHKAVPGGGRPDRA